MRPDFTGLRPCRQRELERVETVLLDLDAPAGQLELPIHDCRAPLLRFVAICSVGRIPDQPVEYFLGRQQIALPRALNESCEDLSQILLGHGFEDHRTEASYLLGVRIPRAAGVAGCEAATRITRTV